MFLIVVFKFYFFNVYFLVAAAFIEIYCQYITILNLKPRLSDSLHSRSLTLYFSITLLRLKADVTLVAKLYFLTEMDICIVQQRKKRMGYHFVTECNHAQESHASQFFSTIFAGPRFVEIQNLCYHGYVT